MLRAELLRSKKDEIAGRYFNDTTLPPLPDVATLTALLSSHQTNDNPQQKLEAGLDKSNETSTPDFGRKSLVGLGCGPGSHDEVEASSPHANARNNRSQGSPSRTKATASQTDFAIEPAVDPSTPHADTDHSRVLETSRIRSEVESPSGSPGVNPSRTALSPSDEPTPLENSHLSAGERGLQILGEADREGASQDTSPISENAFASRKKDREKPAPLTGLSSFADQPSSPTSTLGPYSSNTPGVTAGSPDTSPDEELPAGVQQTRGTASLPKSLPASSVSNMSAGVPSIPEERSRMEVAHSLDSSSIPDHQSNGEAASTSQTETSDSGMKAQSNAESSLAKDYHHPTNGANSFGESEISRTPSLKPDGPPATHSTAVDEDAVMEDAPDDQPNPPTLSEEQKQPSSRKPTMWIDTKTASGVTPSDHPVTTAGSGPDRMVESPVTIASSITPKRPHLPSSSSAQSPPERMTTRVSSGAIRHKSVSEILGETPKHGPAQPDRSAADKMSSDSSRAGSVADSPIPVSGRDTPEPLTIKLRHGERTLKEKERSKLSTVVFAKPQTMDRSDGVEPVPRQNVSEASQSSNAEKDYLFTLFQQRAYFPPRSLQLSTLLSSAHKTLTTSNLYIDHQEQMDCRSLRRIYHLQNANRWPLRQMQRSVEPERPTSHWDFVLSEMKWMRTDYREEKKWKIAAAAACADWCAEFVASDREQRRKLQVTVKARMAPLQADGSRDVEMVDDRVEAATSNAHPTPDLVPSAEDDSVSDGVVEDPSDLFDSAAPAAIFSLPSSDFTFQMKRTPATEKLLDELPLYEPVKWVPGTELPNLAAVSDSAWKTDLLPVSKYATGKIRFKENKPPRKRSRYEYEEYSAVRDRAIILTPEQTDVALFMPENKHIRDRIHPGHSFRPPTEHPMPAQAFFESRQSSQWTVTEDDELRRLVKEYSYNWSLISSCLSSPSLFSSGAERRTPWECFERWIGLEGLPADMSKTPYFRAYHSRIEAAQRTVLAQQHAAQQQQGSNPNQGPMRRRTTQPVRVDRRRSSKHLALLDAMRKLAKKRETALQKQQHAAGLAAMRKANEATQPRPPISMPQEFSRLKHERECKMQERQELYRQQVLAHQRAAMQQRNAQQPNQRHALTNGITARNASAVPNDGASPIVASSLPNGHPHPNAHNQTRPHPPMPGVPNGAQANGSNQISVMGMNGIPQAHMQANVTSNQQRIPGSQMSPDNVRVFLEARAVQQQQEQQRKIQQQRQQQQFAAQQQQAANGGPHSSPNMGIAKMNGLSNNNLTALAATNGHGSLSFNNAGVNAGSSVSPHMNQPQPLSSGVVPAISSLSSQLQAKHPQASPEQINKMATDRLNQYQYRMSINQQALNAAAGNVAAVPANYSLPTEGGATLQPAAGGTPGHGTGASGATMPRMTNEQVYAQMLKTHQPGGQHARVGRGSVGGGGSPVMNVSNPARPVAAGSRSATPQTQGQG